jgi:hypothetical protein
VPQRRQQLDRAEEMARRLQEPDFASAIRAQVAQASSRETAAAYEQAMPPEQSFHGLVRYLGRTA